MKTNTKRKLTQIQFEKTLTFLCVDLRADILCDPGEITVLPTMQSSGAVLGGSRCHVHWGLEKVKEEYFPEDYIAEQKRRSIF